jgi:hypothetical protein
MVYSADKKQTKRKAGEPAYTHTPHDLVSCFSISGENTEVGTCMLYDKAESKVVAFTGFLNPQECENLISWMETNKMERAYHEEGKGYTFRDVDRLQISDDEVAALIFKRLKPYIPEDLQMEDCRSTSRAAIGCNECIRLYRYAVGQRYAAPTIHYFHSIGDC